MPLPEVPKEDNGKTFDMRHEYIRKVDVVDALNKLYSKLGRRADKLIVQEILYDNILPYGRQDSRNDVKEVEHGHWLPIVGYDPRDAWDKCSRCQTTVQHPGTKYCPECGAKMDEEVENV